MSQENAFLCSQVRALEKKIVALGTDADEARLVAVLAQLCDFFTGDLQHHPKRRMEEFTALVADLAGGTWKAARLHTQQMDLRDAVEEFHSEMDLASSVGSGTRRALLWRLIDGAKAILKQLKSHAEFEAELVRELNSNS
jgi:hypothetical protein